MKKQHRAFLGLCLAGTLLLCTGFTADTAFSDVPTTSPYYQAVEYLVDAGIVSGYDDGGYHPDRAITPGEYAAILTRVLYPGENIHPVEGKPWFYGYYTYLIRKDVITLPEYKFFIDGNVTWQVVWRTLLPQMGVYYYPAEYYYDVNSLPWFRGTEYHNAAVAAIATGLFPEDKSTTDTPTRGEVALAAYRLLTGRFTPLEEVPVILELLDPNVPLNPVSYKKRESILSAVEYLPENVLESFTGNGWKLRLSGVYADHPEFAASTLGGLCCYTDKLIYLESNSISTVIHEFGHYMEYDTQSELLSDSVFQQEHEVAVGVIEEYAQTNAREYFACAVEEYLLNEEGRQSFRKELPLTYALVDGVLQQYS